MKLRAFSTYLLALLVVLLPACDSLQEEPLTEVTSDNFFQNADQAERAVLGAYNSFLHDGAYNGAILNATIYQTPALERTPEGASFYNNFNWDPSQLGSTEIGNQVFFNTNVGTYWATGFMGVAHANNVINRLPDVEELKEGGQLDRKGKRYLGEARFIRALHYFNLVRIFGDVPLRTESEVQAKGTPKFPRAPKSRIYKQIIIPDLKYGAKNLPASVPGGGRATKGAANTLLAKVYLRLASEKANNVFPNADYSSLPSNLYALARDRAKRVMDAGNYDLLADYREVFDPEFKNTKEHIFSAQFIGGVLSSHFDYQLRPSMLTDDGLSSGADNALILQKWYDKWPDTYRRFVSAFPESPSGQGSNVDEPRLKKWSPGGSSPAGNYNLPILRYADVLLIYAESANEANGGPNQGAVDAINKVRSRARGAYDGGISPDSLQAPESALPPLTTGMSQQQFRRQVWRERELEFLGEGYQYFDYVREGRLVSANQAASYCGACQNVAPRHTTWPIPQDALDKNSALTQSDGY